MWRLRLLLKKQNRDTLKRWRLPVYLLIIILSGLILRIYNLGKFGFWFDEAFYLLSANNFRVRTSPSILTFLINSKGPGLIFFFIILRGWMYIASSDFFLRFFSVICGILSIIIIYRLGEFIFSKKIGILSALILSISPLHIYYSQELTPYSLSVFLALSSSYCFLKFLKSPNRISSIFYTLSTLGFIHTHPINLIFILIQNIFFYLFYYKDKYLLKEWLYLQLTIFLLTLPWLGIVIFQFLRFSQLDIFYWIPKPNLNMFLQTFMIFSGGYHISWKLQLIALAIFILFSLKAILFYWHKNNEIFYLIFWLVIPTVLIWLISQFHSFYLHRIFFFALPAFCLLTATGITRIKRYLEVGIICLYLILITYSLKNYYENKFPYNYRKRYISVCPKKDYQKSAIDVGENFQKGDVILHICRSSLVPFIYYHREKLPEFGIKLNNTFRKDWQLTPVKKEIFKYEYLEIKKRNDLINYKRIWLIHSSWDFEGKKYLPSHDRVGKTIIDWFDRNFLREKIEMFEGINIYLFSSTKKVH